ncbi:MAG: hypothetical protein IIU08_06555 [Clostridia bacterium]|nr:hypothetical protein [Clostridia bacterium]
MPRKKKETVSVDAKPPVIRDQQITETIETNYMPYAMSVIVSRAIPDQILRQYFHQSKFQILNQRRLYCLI